MIDDLVREGARRMLAQALQAEVDAYIAAFATSGTRTGAGWWCATARTSRARYSPRPARWTWPRPGSMTGAPTGDRRAPRFASAILPPWCRKTPKIAEVLPLLYLHGLSSGDSCPRWDSSSAPGGPVRADDHEADRDLEGRAAGFYERDYPGRTTSTCGPTASMSRSGWRSTNCACW